ncbi:alpha/beta hydrolase [Uliginosibacterium sp. 31-16]|uniref:alpha/beta fold hydrolase n=1 Tax=Uliginosibacterium sp. 31-16 TaxID=3068315 RepID=UPI00273F5AEB|nr:alpha/beta hydrolase [Uliginosibacterium sp. 31-16]MDP5239903.1 alpha/beta hydrolase [Uliginosibacterium sp. 31-16]
MRRGKVQCLTGNQLHQMVYTEWGEVDNPHVLICVHGLTRNGRDFDALAQTLSRDYRVICPDVAGRGQSDWLDDGAAYVVPIYMQHMVTLIARMGVARVDWVGTSMGGLIGMGLAALAHSPIRRLVLNDVGPLINAQAICRIGEYVGRAPRFESIEAAEAYVRGISAGFGALSDAQWRHLTLHSLRQDGDGWRMGYDPAIGDTMRSTLGNANVNLWSVYEQIHCPTLVLRGAESDLLGAATVAEMSRRGPCAESVEIAAVGHAPMLMDPAQIAVVRDFLLRP